MSETSSCLALETSIRPPRPMPCMQARKNSALGCSASSGRRAWNSASSRRLASQNLFSRRSLPTDLTRASVSAATCPGPLPWLSLSMCPPWPVSRASSQSAQRGGNALGVRVHRRTGLAKHGMRGDGGPTAHQRGWDGVTALTSRRGGPRLVAKRSLSFLGRGGYFADDSRTIAMCDPGGWGSRPMAWARHPTP